MVIDDVQDHFDARLVQLTYQCLEFDDLASGRRLCRIARLRREEGDGVVPPVVGQSPVEEKIFDMDFLYRKQLDGIDSEHLQVRNLFDEAKVRSRVLHGRRSMRSEPL